ncbi:MAG: MBL fold metallo-hydrolase [Deltaproteobacteria bacterium]|nr:MBL fold metallo-hydrolase [Deltaproteobacteria bacterium]
MKKIHILIMFFILMFPFSAPAQQQFATDVIPTPAGDARITFLGHGTLMLAFAGKIIHIDPFSKVADYATLPRADIILLTHDHYDHLDPQALKLVRTTKSVVILTEASAKQLQGGIVMHNGEEKTVQGVKIEAVPAYNLVHRRDDGQPFHPKGDGNGYVLTLGGKRIYIAGDTENIPEMKALRDIDVAFLPMNLPYTMTPEMAAEAAKSFQPKILYPYHFGETDPMKLEDLLKDAKGIELRIRNLQ